MNSTNSDITVVQLHYHPKMMLKVILYAYTQSVFSGRKIEKMLNDSIRMMWLSQNQKNLLIKQLIDLE
jgi:transposase